MQVIPTSTMSPLVSLVITVYNREQYLSDAIESILTQTYTDFELLIWDDGSTDDSVEIAQHYATQDKRIRVIAAPHQGRAPALKAAMAEATGTYVGWVDSDDCSDPQNSDKQLRVVSLFLGGRSNGYKSTTVHSRVQSQGRSRSPQWPEDTKRDLSSAQTEFECPGSVAQRICAASPQLV
jgi:hypothetical protein